VLANGYGFVQITFKSGGQLPLQTSIKKAAEIRNISWNDIYTYLIKRLSVTKQKVIAQNVNYK
jgi:hypothetical protein